MISTVNVCLFLKKIFQNLLYLIWKFSVFKLKENVYVVEFEILNSDDGFICIAAALSDGMAIYMFTDHSNVILAINLKSSTKSKSKNLRIAFDGK